MNQSRSYTSFSLVAATAVALTTTALAAGPRGDVGETVDASPIVRASGRCAAYGPDVVEMGNGVCGRVASHARIEVHPRVMGANSWTGGGTSSANLRSDGSGMVPGAISSQHLRVRSGLESYNPFR